MNAFQWLSLMQPFRKGRNICYIFLLTHFNFLLLNDAWCSEYIMNVILPPLGYLNEKLCSHNWKMEVFKSQLSLFYFASAKAVVNKYLCMCKCFQSLKHYIIYALKQICPYETENGSHILCCSIPESHVQTCNKFRIVQTILYSMKVKLIQSMLKYDLKHRYPIIFFFVFFKSIPSSF